MQDNTALILWVMGGGFSVLFALMSFMWHSLTKSIEKLDEKLTDVDRRLCRLEGAFTSKDCCMMKDDRQARKAE